MLQTHRMTWMTWVWLPRVLVLFPCSRPWDLPEAGPNQVHQEDAHCWKVEPASNCTRGAKAYQKHIMHIVLVCTHPSHNAFRNPVLALCQKKRLLVGLQFSTRVSLHLCLHLPSKTSIVKHAPTHPFCSLGSQAKDSCQLDQWHAYQR